MGYVNAMFSADSELELNSLSALVDQNFCAGIKDIKMRELSRDFTKLQIVVELSNCISYDTIRTQLYFMYTGELPQNVNETLEVQFLFIAFAQVIFLYCAT